MRSKDMADVADTQDSPVGVYPPGRARHTVPSDAGADEDSVVQPFRAGSSDDKTRAEALDYQENPGEELIFDAGKLHAQLADLLQIYLKRAADPNAVQKCSAKDAISCAKTLTSMMSDVQSGKPASVNSWSGDLQVYPPRHRRRRVTTPLIARPRDLPARAGRASGVKGRCRVRSRAAPSSGRAVRELPLQPIRPATDNEHLPAQASAVAGPTTILEDALSVVLASDEETAIPEPHKRLIARIQKLCTETQKRLDETPNRVGGVPRFAGRRSENEDCPKDAKSRASEPDLPKMGPPIGRVPRGAPDSDDGDPPVGARHAVPSDEGNDEDSVVQPFRAGSSDDKTRAKALDYRENVCTSRAGEPGVPNMDVKRRGTSPRPTDNSAVTSPIPNPSPLTPSSASPKARKRRTLYTLGTSLKSGNYRLESLPAGLEGQHYPVSFSGYSCLADDRRLTTDDCAPRAPPTPKTRCAW